MFFDENLILVRRVDNDVFWEGTNKAYVSWVPVWWFPLNWITVPIKRFKRKLAQMQSEHYDL